LKKVKVRLRQVNMQHELFDFVLRQKWKNKKEERRSTALQGRLKGEANQVHKRPSSLALLELTLPRNSLLSILER
ncbi:hypothetical protein, partial [Latilactobacillus graminis]|uniref:hypothetical protein n=1 Tax=Latilactobacillus graminis TaxID=60519 RepID=UPI001F22B55F